MLMSDMGALLEQNDHAQLPAICRLKMPNVVA